MRTSRKLLAALVGSVAILLLAADAAVAQVSIDPSTTPVENKSATGPLGPWTSLAQIMLGLGVLTIVLLTLMYLRYSPRFSSDEEHFKVVRADRVRVGRELPRRAVDVSQAVPVVVAPPAIPGASPAAPPPAAPAPPPAAPAAPAAAVPAAAAPAPAAAPPAAEAPPAEAPAPAAERPEVALDEAVFQQTLDELLAKGTSRRVAEGQARRAAMIAARKAAGG